MHDEEFVVETRVYAAGWLLLFLLHSLCYSRLYKTPICGSRYFHIWEEPRYGRTMKVTTANWALYIFSRKTPFISFRRLSWCVSQLTAVMPTPWATRREKPIQSLLSKATAESQDFRCRKKRAQHKKPIGGGRFLVGLTEFLQPLPSINIRWWCAYGYFIGQSCQRACRRKPLWKPNKKNNNSSYPIDYLREFGLEETRHQPPLNTRRDHGSSK